MVSLLTAMIIQENKTEIYTYQNKNSKKWGYEIAYFERDNYRSLITCQAMYDSKKDAEKNGKDLVAEIKKVNLSPKRKEIKNILGDSKETVQAIIDASKKP